MQSIRHSFGVVRVLPLRTVLCRPFSTSHLLCVSSPVQRHNSTEKGSSEPRKTSSPAKRKDTTKKGSSGPRNNSSPAKRKGTKKKGQSAPGESSRALWSPEEESLLLKLRQERLAWSTIATHFPSRSLCSLKNKCEKIAPRGEQGRYMHSSNRFTDSERALIFKLRAEGVQWRDIQTQHFPGRNWKPLMDCFLNTRPPGEGDVWNPRSWSKEDSEKLLMLREEMKMSFPELANALNRSISGVREKYRKMVRKRSESVDGGDDTGYVHVNKRNWPEEDEAKLAEMLRNGATQKEISEVWPRWKSSGLYQKIGAVKRQIGLVALRNLSPLNKRSVARLMKLRAKGFTIKEIAALMPEFTLSQIKRAHRQALNQKREPKATNETRSQAKKE